ncbi:MAG: ATP-dependent helicase [Planctomycetales bacterium]
MKPPATETTRRVDDSAAAMRGLNPRQRQAVEHGEGPLLIVAGAGTGKTHTLVHRVTHHIETGISPERILLLTFTRRAAREMLRRVDCLTASLRLAASGSQQRSAATGRKVWGGTFHAVAARLLRLHGRAIGLDAGFTILDRGDSEDLMHVVRVDLDLAKTDKRFPKKGTCAAVHGHCVNSQQPLETVLNRRFPWCVAYADDLKRLFQAYADRKEAAAALDYDDLLLGWRGMTSDPDVGDLIRGRFDRVLVDEYQDTNTLQFDVLKSLRPHGIGLTVVGDDAQSIYSFRAATVRNILDFPKEFPSATVVALEQNYRASRPILNATNQVIGQARERFTKNLWTEREGGSQPILLTVRDEVEQAEQVTGILLEQREAGVDLRDQAVLYRASHHAILLEAELTRRNIPYVKFGGRKFMEAMHVKDLLAHLRLAENPRDLTAGMRVLELLPGIGSRTARRLMNDLEQAGGDFQAWKGSSVPTAARSSLPDLVALMELLGGSVPPVLSDQIEFVRNHYAPLLIAKHDHAESRLLDLEQVQALASRFSDRREMLAEIALDPPESTQALAGDASREDEYVTLSTIHSCKGLEWSNVYLLNAADGDVPNSKALGSVEEIEEELRLLYVAMTRAKNLLCVCLPLRCNRGRGGPMSDGGGLARLTRFIPNEIRDLFECRTTASALSSPPARHGIRQDWRTSW